MQNIRKYTTEGNLSWINTSGSIENSVDKYSRILKIRVSVVQPRSAATTGACAHSAPGHHSFQGALGSDPQKVLNSCELRVHRGRSVTLNPAILASKTRISGVRRGPAATPAPNGAIFSPSSKRAINLSLSSIGLHSFQGIWGLPKCVNV